MIQYQVKYITHNDRIAVCYLYADNFEEVTASANILQGCKEVISIKTYEVQNAIVRERIKKNQNINSLMPLTTPSFELSQKSKK